MQLIKPTPCLTPKQKTKKMHVASVTLTNNNESNEKQMLGEKKKLVRFKPYERTS